MRVSVRPHGPGGGSADRGDHREGVADGETRGSEEDVGGAFGYVLHWPRDGNCPPPEIGYGGRAFPNTPKDYVPPRD